MHLLYVALDKSVSVECMDDGWFKQPHLASQADWTLGMREAAHGSMDHLIHVPLFFKLTQHNKKTVSNITSLCPCCGEAKYKPCSGNIATLRPMWGLSRQEKGHRAA